MATFSQKQVKVNNMNVLETNIIFARAMALHCSGQPNYEPQHMMAHELAHRPAPVYDDHGATAVAKIKTNLKVDLARRHAYVGWVCNTVCRPFAYMCNYDEFLHIPSPHPAIWNPVMST